MMVTLEITHKKNFADYLQDARRAYLLVALQRASGNMTHAAKASGLNRTHFLDLIRHHGLSDYARGLRETVADLEGNY